MRTLGVDPGTAIMGFGVIDDENGKIKPVDFGCFRTSKENAPCERLLKLYSELEKTILKYKPDTMALEKIFFCSNSKTAVSVGEARGIVLLSAAQFKMPVYEYTPLQVKMAITGYGKADKKQIQQMVKNLLNLKEIPYPDDAADALAIAICHNNSLTYSF